MLKARTHKAGKQGRKHEGRGGFNQHYLRFPGT